jgi:hypothetical protein
MIQVQHHLYVDTILHFKSTVPQGKLPPIVIQYIVELLEAEPMAPPDVVFMSLCGVKNLGITPPRDNPAVSLWLHEEVLGKTDGPINVLFKAVEDLCTDYAGRSSLVTFRQPLDPPDWTVSGARRFVQNNSIFRYNR